MFKINFLTNYYIFVKVNINILTNRFINSNFKCSLVLKNKYLVISNLKKY